MTSEPSWKFWHPLPFWRVLLIFAGAQILVALVFVLLREGLGLAIPYGAGGAAGGILGVLTVSSQASKLRKASRE